MNFSIPPFFFQRWLGITLKSKNQGEFLLSLDQFERNLDENEQM